MKIMILASFHKRQKLFDTETIHKAKVYLMKHVFTLVLLTITLHTSLHSALQKPAAPAYDNSADWRAAYQLPLEPLSVLKGIPLSKENKPIMYAACTRFINYLGEETVIKILIDYAAINTPEDLQTFCTSQNVKLSDDEMRRYTRQLTNLNALEDQIFAAVPSNDCTLIRACLKQGARVNAHIACSGITALMLSANGHIDCMQLLLEQPNVDVNAKADSGNTATILAARNKESGCLECLRLLLRQKNIDVNAQNSYGNTPLICAAKSRRTECIRLLLAKKDINITMRNRDSDTALIIAMNGDYTDIVECFNWH